MRGFRAVRGAKSIFAGVEDRWVRGHVTILLVPRSEAQGGSAMTSHSHPGVGNENIVWSGIQDIENG